jgi:aerobic-type carbon monoxide dehydrogenase small subunit (CoxS/CutS family)
MWSYAAVRGKVRTISVVFRRCFMMQTYQLTVNGAEKSVKADERQTLLDVLREDLGLTGTKYGCGEGQCGSCTVLVDGKPAFSCTTKIGQVANKGVTTIEGLAKDGKLHPVQAAFLEEGAFQCGYCTPGMILETVALLAEKPKPTETEIVSRLNGHICRCGGYMKVIRAVVRAAGGGGGEVRP